MRKNSRIFYDTNNEFQSSVESSWTRIGIRYSHYGRGVDNSVFSSRLGKEEVGPFHAEK